MSFEYYAAVPAQKWPNVGELQAYLDRYNLPLKLIGQQDGPLLLVPDTLGLPVEYDGQVLELEAEVALLDPQDADSDLVYIADVVGDELQLSDGDPFLILSFRSSDEEIRAGLLLLGALIKLTGGQGFENAEETHGGEAFADELIATALDPHAFDDNA